jgi:autotransporter-associated beta strand protein
MTMGANMALNSITFNGSSGSPANTNPVSLSSTGGYTLTLDRIRRIRYHDEPRARGRSPSIPTIALGNDADLDQQQFGNALTVNGVVSSGGNTLTKAGTGDVILSGANTYSGGTVVNAGTLTSYAGSAAGTKAMFGPARSQ